MRRPRSRLPFIVAGGIALLLGATLGIAASDMRPSSEALAWLGGQKGAPSATRIVIAAGDPALTAGPAAMTSGGEPPIATPSAAVRSGSIAAAASIAAAGGAGAPVTPAATTAPPSSGGPTPAPSISGGPTPAPSISGGTVGPSPATAIGVQAKAVYNGSRKKKVVALTFDDGYSPVALRRILAILKREHVTATFFPYGWAVHNDPAGWHMVVAAGHPIGNHTLTHATLTSLTPDQVTSELVRGQRTIDLYSGGKSINLMRPPGGAFNAATARAIAKAGYQTIVMWDVDTFDWQGPSPATILARATRGTNGSIVLMHSGPLNTPRALPAIIANYRARGFSFVTVPELLVAR